METVIYTDAGENNDTVRVQGTSFDDDLTVAAVPTTGITNASNSALVFLNGNPYLQSPPVDLTNVPSHNLPGVAGGGTGPDMLINGMTGGYTGEGFKTVIPAMASAKISFRLVFDQDPHKVRAAFRAFVSENVASSHSSGWMPGFAGSSFPMPPFFVHSPNIVT